MVVLDKPVEAQAGDCLGVGYEDGGIATLHFVPGENSRKESRVCQGPSVLADSASEVTHTLLEHRHCTEVSRQYLMRVGYLDVPPSPPSSSPRSSPVPPQPEQAERKQASELDNQNVQNKQAQGAAHSPPRENKGGNTEQEQERDACVESTHKMWIADGTKFPREVQDQDTISLAKVKLTPNTFQLKTCFQLPQSMWKTDGSDTRSSKVVAVQFSFGAAGVLQTAWEDYCVTCVQSSPGNRAEISSPPLQLNMLGLAGAGLGPVWKTKVKVILQGCPKPLVFASDGIQIVP